MKEITNHDTHLISGGDEGSAYHNIGHAVGDGLDVIGDAIGAAHEAAVSVTTDFLCWASGNC